MHWATQESHSDSIQLLLAEGADLEQADDEGHFPLFQAAGDGSLEIVKLLIEAGAAVNRVCNSGSALSIACAYEHVEIVRYLMSEGADPGLADCEGVTARSIAIDYQSGELLELLTP